MDTIEKLGLELFITEQTEIIDIDYTCHKDRDEAVRIALLGIQRINSISMKKKLANAIAMSVTNAELDQKGFIDSLTIPDSWKDFFRRDLKATLKVINQG